jgi:hypothetical protein
MAETKPEHCPLCKGEAVDRGYGVECRRCGLWLGSGTMTDRLGGYKRVWNMRTEARLDAPPRYTPHGQRIRSKEETRRMPFPYPPEPVEPLEPVEETATTSDVLSQEDIDRIIAKGIATDAPPLKYEPETISEDDADWKARALKAEAEIERLRAEMRKIVIGPETEEGREDASA